MTAAPNPHSKKLLVIYTRQFTGRPWIHRAYVVCRRTGRVVVGCVHRHRSVRAAEVCARKLLTAEQREREVLEMLDHYEADQWVRPMDIGGRDGSHHSATLSRLCRKGLVRRRPRRTLLNALRGCTDASKRASSWEYQIVREP